MAPLTRDSVLTSNGYFRVLKVGQLIYCEVDSLPQAVRVLPLEVLHFRCANLEPQFVFSQDYAHEIRLPPIGESLHALRSNDLSFPERQGFPPTLKELLIEDEGLRM